MSDDVEQAEKTLVALRSKRDALVAHGIELGEQRQHVAFAAHTGDAAARKKLDAINREAALHDSELRSLDAAIVEAAERVNATPRVPGGHALHHIRRAVIVGTAWHVIYAATASFDRAGGLGEYALSRIRRAR